MREPSESITRRILTCHTNTNLVSIELAAVLDSGSEDDSESDIMQVDSQVRCLKSNKRPASDMDLSLDEEQTGTEQLGPMSQRPRIQDIEEEVMDTTGQGQSTSD